ncbi:hypothetical protein ACFYY1_41190 [Streptomyces sp. NPDC001890]|uniref:hypothetical protein n=1 Tax=Streptomyces sp. NPDC001890 TaxID=3364620 RepID=UPI00369C51A4
MASALAMGEETYRHLETTGERGRLARARYDDHEDRWIAWQEWAAPLLAATAERLDVAEEHTREQHRVERERRWQRLRLANPEYAARIEELGRAGRALRER